MIRHPHEGDWDEVLRLGHAMHEESWFRAFDFSEEKVRRIFDSCLHDPSFFALVATADEKLAGFFCGAVTEHFFGFDHYACDLAMYVAPEHRGGRLGLRFLRMYETWCAYKGVREIHLGISTGVTDERTAKLYERLGFTASVRGFRKACLAAQPLS